MFLHRSDSSITKKMEFCDKFSSDSGETWGSCVTIKPEVPWTHSVLQRNFVENTNNYNQNNNYYTQSVSTKSNPGLWRKEDTIPDWQKYLNSTTSNSGNPVYNINKAQTVSTQSHNASGNPVNSKPLSKEASIADWEAYLYSRTPIPVNKVTQIPGSIPGNASNTIKITPPNLSHQAHISFVHSNGVLKPIVKRKRKRTAFTTEQVEALENVFYKRPYVSREERQILTNKLQVSDKAVKVWFQNRRLKVKKEKEEQEYESDTETADTQDAGPLAYVESQIHKADEFGFVTLDDRAIRELVTVIDHFLPKDADLGNTDSEKSESDSRLCSVSESECSVIYEPISPPDFTDTPNQQGMSQNWETFQAVEPKKSLQNLLDVHFMCDCNNTSLSIF